MHDNHIRLRSSKYRMVDNVRFADSFPFPKISEALLLNASDIQYIRLRQYLVKRIRLRNVDSSPSSRSDDSVRHGEFWRRDKIQADGVEAEKSDETVDGSTIFEISEESD